MKPVNKKTYQQRESAGMSYFFAYVNISPCYSVGYGVRLSDVPEM